MSYFFTGILCECDTRGCNARLEIKNEDGLSGAALWQAAEAKDWILPMGGGKVFCPKCKKIGEMKYNAKLTTEPVIKTKGFKKANVLDMPEGEV